MAKQIDNSYTSTANYISANSLVQTNQWADSGNAVKLYGIDTYGTRHTVAFTWASSGTGAGVTLTPTSGASTATDYFKFRITDQSGTEAYGNFVSSAPTNAFLINTSSLDPDDDWKVLFSTSNNSGATKVEFSFDIGTGAIYANSSATVSYTIA